ncbi:growth/differentiation factor 8-like [Haliotis rubra]|uniref:growth/differentiation factor 8-like n=1 Tax=Haliotis rubra TaxID=36100 RepID=UPI001EE5CB35|nr:growth/differentiation factor 8-like [Haliotis rubra]
MLCVCFVVVAAIGIAAGTEDDGQTPFYVNASAFAQQILKVPEQTISRTSEAPLEKSTSATPLTSTPSTDEAAEIYRKTNRPLSKGIDWKDDIGSDLSNTNSKSKRKMIKKLTREREREERRRKRKQKTEEKRLYMAGRKSQHSKSKDRKVDSEKPAKKTCLECEKKLKKENLEKMRRESFKKQVIEKLRLDLSRPVRIPVLSQEILRHGIMDDESVDDDDGYAKTTDIILFAADITRKCRYRKSTGCFKFNLRNKIDGQVTSAELLIYKLHDPNDGQQSFILSELERPKFRKHMPRNIVTRMDTDITEGWLTFRLDKTVQKWAENSNMNDGIAVRCKTCARESHKQLYSAKEGYKPVLIVHIKPTSKRRPRRSVECVGDNTRCCKHNFWIKFSEIDLIHILRPAGVWANYCTGSCDLMTTGHFNHTGLLQSVRWSDVANDTIRNAITPCCGAVRLSTMSLLYANERGDIRQVDVPDLGVEECGCL